MLANEVGPLWRQAQRVYYRADQFTPQRGEEVFRDAGLYPIRAYLSAWGRHNRQVLEAVPPERVLVIRTSEITRWAERIGAFLRIDPKSIDTERGHQYVNDRKFHMLDRVDPHFLEDTMHECRGDVSFQGVKSNCNKQFSFGDVRLRHG